MLKSTPDMLDEVERMGTEIQGLDMEGLYRAGVMQSENLAGHCRTTCEAHCARNDRGSRAGALTAAAVFSTALNVDVSGLMPVRMAYACT